MSHVRIVGRLEGPVLGSAFRAISKPVTKGRSGFYHLWVERRVTSWNLVNTACVTRSTGGPGIVSQELARPITEGAAGRCDP